MAAKRTLESRFLDKIVSVYLRLLEEDRDEHEVRRLVDAFITKALVKLGFKGTAEKMAVRAKQLAAMAEERAKRELERKKFLMELKVGEESCSYTVEFLPNVKIPNTPENQALWREFLCTLAPKTRIGPDPDSGEIGILFRDGQWLGDMMLADDVSSFSIIPSITDIRGSLTARGARVINKAFTHKVSVGKDLCVHKDILRLDPPDVTYGGGLKLIGLKSMLDARFGPDRLLAWGMKDGTGLTIRSDSFTMRVEEKGGTPAYTLQGENVLSNYTWRNGKWNKRKQERLDDQTFEEVHSKLHRICMALGLGANFIAKSISRVPDNIDRIALYLDFARAGTAKPDGDDPEAEGTRQFIRALYKLRAFFLEKRVDAKGVEDTLRLIHDEDRDQAVALASRPRRKLNEKRAQADLETVTALLDQETDIVSLLHNGMSTARALNLAFRSEDMRNNLVQAVKPLKDAYDTLAKALRSPDMPSFFELIDAPSETLNALHSVASPVNGQSGTSLLEAELREVRALTCKEFVRRVVNVPYSVETEEFLADKTLLRHLFQLGPSELTDLPFDSRTMMAFIVPRLESLAMPRLRDILDNLVKGDKPEDPITAALMNDLIPLSAAKLVAGLRIWVRMNLEVLQKFNELGTIDYGDKREEKRKEKERAMVTLPPDVTREISGRLNRLCLLTGLGRDFVETGDIALAQNLDKVTHYLKISLGLVIGAPKPRLSDEDRSVVQDVMERLQSLRASLDTADADAARGAVKQLGDPALNLLATVLAKPRNTADTILLRKDVAYLDGMRDTRLTPERVFGSSGRFLLFANSCLESTDMKKGVSVYIKPIFFALSKMGDDAGGVTTNDLLRHSDDPSEELNRIKADGSSAPAKKLKKALEKIQSKSITDIVSELRKTTSPDAGEDLKRDMEFLGRVLALDGVALGTLQLDEKRCGLLLLLNLESHMAAKAKTMFETGRFAGKTSKQIVALVLDEAKREYSVLKAYNKLSTSPR